MLFLAHNRCVGEVHIPLYYCDVVLLLMKLLHCKNGSVTLTQVGLSELQLHYQTMCKQVNQKKNCTTVSLKLLLMKLLFKEYH